MLIESGVKDVTQLQDVSDVIAAIGELVKVLDCIVMVNVSGPEVSAVVTEDGETYRDVAPLGDGVHIVLSIGAMANSYGPGIHEVGT